MQKITFAALFFIAFLAFAYAAPNPMPEAEPETDETRQAFMNCLKYECKSQCQKSRWRLFATKKCDYCAKVKCQAADYGYTEWMAYNQFLVRWYKAKKNN